ncbi:Signal Peptidase I [Sesbania bispinosa]|nr:Signal Peptidase I [Sesbania bispinosa]
MKIQLPLLRSSKESENRSAQPAPLPHCRNATASHISLDPVPCRCALPPHHCHSFRRRPAAHSHSISCQQSSSSFVHVLFSHNLHCSSSRLSHVLPSPLIGQVPPMCSLHYASEPPCPLQRHTLFSHLRRVEPLETPFPVRPRHLHLPFQHFCVEQGCRDDGHERNVSRRSWVMDEFRTKAGVVEVISVAGCC